MPPLSSTDRSQAAPPPPTIGSVPSYLSATGSAPRNRNRTFQRVHGFLVTDLVTKRGQQARFGRHRNLAHVHQHETARAVGVLRFARAVTGLTEKRSLLVAQITRDGQCLPKLFSLCHIPQMKTDLRQHRARNGPAAAKAHHPNRGYSNSSTKCARHWSHR
jgi:hypothetical protein